MQERGAPRWSKLALTGCCLVFPLLAWPVDPARAQARKPAPTPSLQQLQEAANTSRERGDVEASLKLYKQALAREGHWQEGWWYYGSLLYDADRYPEAKVAFERLVDENGKLGDAWAMLGLSEYECKDLNDAFIHLEKAEKIGTPLENTLQNIVDYHLALMLNARGDADAASMMLSSLFLRGVRSEDLQVALGLALLRVPLYPQQLDPSRDALVHDAGAIAALVADQHLDQAESRFRELQSSYPTVAFIHYAFGSLLSSLGRDAEAREQFRIETTLNPDSALAYMEWAFLESKAKRYDESKHLAEKAVALSGGSFMAHFLLGNALLNTGDVKGAIPELETSQTLAPEVADIHYSLSRAYARAGDASLAKQEQTQFLTLQRKNALDRTVLRQKYPSAQSITGIRPITPQ